MTTEENQQKADEYRNRCAQLGEEICEEIGLSAAQGFSGLLDLIILLEPEVAKRHGVPTEAMAGITQAMLESLREKSLRDDETSGNLPPPQ